MACRFRPQLEGAMAPQLSGVEGQKGKRSRVPSFGDLRSTGGTAGTSGTLHASSRHATMEYPRYGAATGGGHARASAVAPTSRQQVAQQSRVRQQG